MDITTILGLIVGVVLVGWGMLSNGSISDFASASSFLLVMGGTVAGTMISFPSTDLSKIGAVTSKVIKTAEYDANEIIGKIIKLANVARREGLLALEEAVEDINDDFLKKGVMLIVDGTDPALVKTILETELDNQDARHARGRSIYEMMGALCPAFGMVGTLVGLIAMLKSLSDPSSIGPKMGVALITTFYGTLFANLFFIPVAEKLKLKSKDEELIKNIMIEGLLSIQAGENPRIIEEKLKVFLSPSVRNTVGTQEATSENG